MDKVVFKVADNVFDDAQAVTENVISDKFSFASWDVKLIDMPGLEDGMTQNEFFAKLAEAFYEAKDGVDAILLCSRLGQRFGHSEKDFTEIFEELGHGHNIWDHCILVFTEGQRAGKTEEERKKSLQDLQHGKTGRRGLLKTWVENVKQRCVVVEAVYKEKGHRETKLMEILNLVSKIRSGQDYTPLKMNIQILADEISATKRIDCKLSKENDTDEEIQKKSVMVLAEALQFLNWKLPEGTGTPKMPEMIDIIQQLIETVKANTAEKEEQSKKMNHFDEELKSLKQKKVQGEQQVKELQDNLQRVEEQKRILDNQIEAQREYLRRNWLVSTRKLYRKFSFLKSTSESNPASTVTQNASTNGSNLASTVSPVPNPVTQNASTNGSNLASTVSPVPNPVTQNASTNGSDPASTDGESNKWPCIII